MTQEAFQKAKSIQSRVTMLRVSLQTINKDELLIFSDKETMTIIQETLKEFKAKATALLNNKIDELIKEMNEL